jgi:hypothetical protein
MPRRPSLRLVLAAAVAAGALAAVAPARLALAEGPFRNLKLLPKTITKEEMKRVMKAQSRDLGVDCEHCHDPDDMAKDTDHKKIARSMMKMTAEINTKWIKDKDAQVTCGTCHQGKAEPPSMK